MIARASLPKARRSGNRSRHLARGGGDGAGDARLLAAAGLVSDNWVMRVESGALLAAALLAGVSLACGEPGASPNNGTPAGAAGAPPSGAGRGDPAAGATGSSGAGGSVGSTGAAGATVTTTAALQYDGTLAFSPVVVGKPQRVEISAPILPRLLVIYGPFPATLDGEKAMAHDAALLFDWLLPRCAPLYPTITLAPDDGSGLSPAQLAVNYDQVGLCAYEQHTSKPYWIPKLVGDVDICGTEMGPDWRLITEADLASLTDADFQAVADTWSLRSIGTQAGLGFFFSSLAIWVRANDGTIKAGTLEPGVTGGRVMPLQVDATSTTHYEGNLGLRCIRRSDLP